MNRIWILGPHSPSMMAIVDLLGRCQETKRYALVDGVRPTALNSSIMMNRDDIDADQVYCVDCSFKNPRDMDRWIAQKPDDEPAKNFMSASLIGQTISTLARLAVLNIHDPALNVTAAELASFSNHKIGEFFFDNMWRVFIGTVQKAGLSMVVPEDLVCAAAAEHCLKEAYAGKCLGVSSGDFLINFRCRQKSAYYASLGQNRSAQSIENDIEAARLALVRHGVIHITSDHLVKDMRESSDLPELEEAALAHGCAYIAYEPEPGIDPKTFNEDRREDMRKARAAVLKARHDLILKTRTGEDFCQKDSAEGAKTSPDVPVAPLKSAEAPRRRILLGGRTTPEMLGAFAKGGFLEKASKDVPAPAKEPPIILKPIPPNMRKACALLISGPAPIEVIRLCLSLLCDLPEIIGEERAHAIGMIHNVLAFTPPSELASGRLLGAQTLLDEVLDANTFTKDDLSILLWKLEQLGLKLLPQPIDEHGAE